MVTSKFGYFPSYTGATEAGLNPAQTFSTGKVSATTVAAAGDQTLTAAIVAGGLLLHDPSGAGVNVTYPSAADIIALVGNAVGTSVDFIHRNTADAAETITCVAGAGMTLSGTATIAQNQQRTWRIVVTGATTVTAYSLGSVAF